MKTTLEIPVDIHKVESGMEKITELHLFCNMPTPVQADMLSFNRHGGMVIYDALENRVVIVPVGEYIARFRVGNRLFFARNRSGEVSELAGKKE